VKDNDLFVALFSVLRAQFARIGRTVTCRRSYPPREHGADSGANIYLFKIGNERRVGSPLIVEVADGLDYAQTCKQVYASTIQASATLDESTDPAGITPSDLLSEAAQILTLPSTIATLYASGMQVERVLDIINTSVVNDHGQYQGSPSFDFVVTYSRQLIPQAVPGAAPDVALYRV